MGWVFREIIHTHGIMGNGNGSLLTLGWYIGRIIGNMFMA